MHYHFTTKEAMQKQIDEGLFLETATVHNNMYGTSRAAVIDVLKSGRVAILDVGECCTLVNEQRVCYTAFFLRRVYDLHSQSSELRLHMQTPNIQPHTQIPTRCLLHTHTNTHPCSCCHCCSADVQGARSIRAAGIPSLFVFVAPPSLEELERRLRTRGTETPESMTRRIKNARQEISTYVRISVWSATLCCNARAFVS